MYQYLIIMKNEIRIHKLMDICYHYYLRYSDKHELFLTLQRCSMSRSVASLTLAHSHSHPLTTMVIAWKFFCLGLGMICTLYWSMMARM